MIVVCAGMLRSGSTWQYQVACELVRRAGRPRRELGFLEGANLAEFLAAPRDPAAFYLYKTHAPDSVHLGLDPAGVRVVYSYRDLRDVAFSMAHKVGRDFWDVARDARILEVCIATDAFWRSVPGAFVQRYEEWMRDGHPFVAAIAGHLGLSLPPGDIAAVAEEFTLEKNRVRTAEFAGRLASQGVDLADPANAQIADPGSQLHWNHIRTGTVGEWRSAATHEQREFLADVCGEWLVANGYEPDWSWAG